LCYIHYSISSQSYELSIAFSSSPHGAIYCFLIPFPPFLVSLKSFSNCLRLLPHLSFTPALFLSFSGILSILLYIMTEGSSLTRCFRRQFPHKVFQKAVPSQGVSKGSFLTRCFRRQFPQKVFQKAVSSQDVSEGSSLTRCFKRQFPHKM
jgi:hypothetical protein